MRVASKARENKRKLLGSTHSTRKWRKAKVRGQWFMVEAKDGHIRNFWASFRFINRAMSVKPAISDSLKELSVIDMDQNIDKPEDKLK